MEVQDADSDLQNEKQNMQGALQHGGNRGGQKAALLGLIVGASLFRKALLYDIITSF
jgi:hypothetical protein